MAINTKNIKLGDVYYITNKHSGYGVIKGSVIEINKVHDTVLLKDLSPYASGNCGAHMDELYDTRIKAILSIK